MSASFPDISVPVTPLARSKVSPRDEGRGASVSRAARGAGASSLAALVRVLVAAHPLVVTAVAVPLFASGVLDIAVAPDEASEAGAVRALQAMAHGLTGAHAAVAVVLSALSVRAFVTRFSRVGRRRTATVPAADGAVAGHEGAHDSSPAPTRKSAWLHGLERQVGRFADDVGAGLFALIGCLFLMVCSGSSASVFVPLLYVTLAGLAALHTLAATALFAAVPVGYEVLRVVFLGGEAAAVSGLHVVYLMAFAGLGALVLRAEVMRGRRRRELAIARTLDRVAAEARVYRLGGSVAATAEAVGATGPDAVTSRDEAALHDETAAEVAAVDAIHAVMRDALAVLDRALDAHTVAVVTFADAGSAQLNVREVRTQSPHLERRKLTASAGVLAAAVKQRRTLTMENLTGRAGILNYYTCDVGVGSFAAVPLFASGAGASGAVEGERELAGLVIADRINPAAFDGAQVGALEAAARQIERTLETEQLLHRALSERERQARFFRASDRLNHALTLDEVYEQFLTSAHEVSGFEFAAVTLLVDGAAGTQVVVTGVGEGFEALTGTTFEAGSSLVAAAVKMREAMPEKPFHRMEAKRRVVFHESVDPAELARARSVKVVPLVARDVAVGTLVIGSSATEEFGDDAVTMLRVIASQAAVRVENAKLFKQMERMATTDGLTGLFNRRTFNERLREAMARAARIDKPVTLLICDVDHFKRVNDTYGHDVGDQVIQRVASVLKKSARETDTVARRRVCGDHGVDRHGGCGGVCRTTARADQGAGV